MCPSLKVAIDFANNSVVQVGNRIFVKSGAKLAVWSANLSNLRFLKELMTQVQPKNSLSHQEGVTVQNRKCPASIFGLNALV